MSNATVSLALALCLLAAPAAAAESAAKKPAPLAATGPVTVSPEEFTLYAQREVGGGLGAVKPEKRRELLVRLTVRKALAAKAVQEGLDRDPAVDSGMRQWKFENYPRLYWTEAVDAAVEVPDKEVWEYVNPADEFHLGVISLGEGEEGAAAARQVMDELGRGEDFVATARRHSVGLSGEKGGDLGWQAIPNHSVTEEMAAAIRATPVGQVTGPLESPVGVVIYLVRARRTAGEIFERYKEDARRELLARKVQVARAERAAELRAKASITYPAKSAPAGKAPLAVVNGYVVLPEVVGIDRHVPMSKEIATQERKLEQFIDALLVVQDAERLGVDQKPELRDGLALERTLILANLALRRNVKEAVPSDLEVRSEYARSYVPEIYTLQMISTTSRERAAEALGKVRAGADFGAVAKEFGKGRLAVNEGRLAPGPIVNFPPAVRAAIEGVPDGGVTGVLELPDGGFGIVKRLAKKLVKVPPLEEVAASIRGRILTRRRAEKLEGLISDFTKGLKITINEELLASL